MEETKKLPGACYRCGDRYYPGHQCKRQLLLLEGDREGKQNAEEIEEVRETGGENDGEISLHALKGIANNKIIKVEGRVKEGSLSILIDSGSTHSFLDNSTARKLKCQLTGTPPLSVVVANGNRVLSNSACLGFMWKMQKDEFEADLRLLQLGGCDVVLGVDWMKGVSPISFDFNRMEVSSEKEGKRMTLTSGQEVATCKMIMGKRLQRVLKSKWNQFTQLFSIVAVEELPGEGELRLTVCHQRRNDDQVCTFPLIDELLADFKDLFVEPKALPPNRTLDHAINLKPNAEPINVRSYRYPPIQKTEIERMVKEMLSQSFIRPSQSPFASPVLLVKKKDGT